MGKTKALSWLWACVLVVALPATVHADWWDSFDDGTVVEPGPWDPCDPPWTFELIAGDQYLTGVDEGRLRITGYSAVLPFLFAGAYVSDGLADPNTAYFTHEQPHYLLANVRTHDDNFDPNLGMLGVWLHGDFEVGWTAYDVEWQANSGWMSITTYSGFTWITMDAIQRYHDGYPQSMIDPSSPFDPNGYDPNDPNYTSYNDYKKKTIWPKDPMLPHWMLIQFDPYGKNHDANFPDDPNDPNCHWIRGAAWMGDRDDWTGVWTMQANCVGALLGENVSDPLAGDFPFDPNVHMDYYVHTEGYNAVAAFSGGEAGSPGSYHCDASYDDFESVTEYFAKNLSLKIGNSSKGVVSIAPDNPDQGDPNTPDERDYVFAYDADVVLTATPTEGSFKEWQVFDPNYPGDTNYAVIDTNQVLVLTMDQDHEVKAVFKCGSSLPPFVAMTLLALGLGVVIRRMV